MKAILPEFLEQLNALGTDVDEDMWLKIDNLGYRHEMHVNVKTGGFRIILDKSNSGRSFQFLGSGVNSGIKEWDLPKVQSIIMSLLARGMSKNKEQRLLRELRVDPKVQLPAIVTKIVEEIHKIYVKEMGGDDYQRRVAEAKKLFDKLKDLVTEEEVVQWYREAHVKTVMES